MSNVIHLLPKHRKSGAHPPKEMTVAERETLIKTLIARAEELSPANRRLLESFADVVDAYYVENPDIRTLDSHTFLITGDELLNRLRWVIRSVDPCSQVDQNLRDYYRSHMSELSWETLERVRESMGLPSGAFRFFFQLTERNESWLKFHELRSTPAEAQFDFLVEETVETAARWGFRRVTMTISKFK